uniref:Synaptonemal complex central element protein 2 n=1 Tax=Cairina moschata TaxID=8855 RepID=A0A8C3CJ72_CAIMO
MSGFRDSLLLKVSDLAEQLEERLFQLYSLHNEQIQQRLHELAEVMERVQQAEDELQHVCHTVEAAYKDLCLQPEAGSRRFLPRASRRQSPPRAHTGPCPGAWAAPGSLNYRRRAWR